MPLEKVAKGEYITWTIYLDMENNIKFSMQKGKAWSYKKVPYVENWIM